MDTAQIESREDRWLTAIHEAGHAVVAHLLGLVPCQLVVHGPEADRAGTCHTQDHSARGTGARDLGDLVDVALAGLVAEMIATGREAWDEDSRDLGRAVGLLMGHVEDCDAVIRELDRSRRRVRRLLEEHWWVVERLAGALEVLGRLGRGEILEILEGAPEAAGCGGTVRCTVTGAAGRGKGT